MGIVLGRQPLRQGRDPRVPDRAGHRPARRPRPQRLHLAVRRLRGRPPRRRPGRTCCRPTPRRTPCSRSPRRSASTRSRSSASRSPATSSTTSRRSPPPTCGSRSTPGSGSTTTTTASARPGRRCVRRASWSTRTAAAVVSGLRDLVVLKSTGSEFADFLVDEFTTLPPTHDRVLATSLAAEWTYVPDSKPDWGPIARRHPRHAAGAVRERALAGPAAVAVGDGPGGAGGACPDVASIELVAPNIHHVAVDLSAVRAGQPGRGLPRDRPALRPDRGRRRARRGGLMEFLSPTTLADALAARAEHPGRRADHGRHRRDGGAELRPAPAAGPARPHPGPGARDLGPGRRRDPARRRRHLHPGDRASSAAELPGLALASRTVGSPQIRNRGTVGGNLGAASPAGDAHPALLAAFAEVELASLDGVRRVPAHEFYTGVKKHAGRPDELITAVWVRAATGPQQFSKIGTRNAMVIAVAAFGLALHPDRQASAPASARRRPPRAGRPTPRRSSRRSWTGSARRDVPADVAAEFGRLVAAAASPIDDVRGTAAYRLHALAVMARRCLGWAWADYQRGGGLMRVTVTVNGERREADDVWEGESLLYVLRERMGLPGSKNACEQGECGSCTVYLDGVTCCACLVAAGQADGRDVDTVEGLGGARRAAPRPAGVPRRRRRAVRLLHAGAARRHPRPARPRPGPRRLRDPRGAGRQPVPLHRLREDHRRRAPGRGGGCGEPARDRRVRGRHDGRRPDGARRRARRRRRRPDRRRSPRAGRPATSPDATYVDGTRLPATPGLVNTHHHLYQWLTRGLRGRPHAVRLADHALPGVGRPRRGHRAQAGATGALVQLARTGCTTTTDHHYVFPADGGDLLGAEIEAARAVGLRFLPDPRLDGPRPEPRRAAARPRGRGDRRDPRRDGRRRSTGTTTRPRTRCCASASPRARRSRSPATCSSRRPSWPGDKGVRLHTHLAETDDEDDVLPRAVRLLARSSTSSRSAGSARTCGSRTASTSTTRASPRWPPAGTGVAHCPSSNARLGAGICRTRDLRDAGVPVGLGVDGAASNEAASLVEELRHSVLFARAVGGPQALTVRDGLELATIGGARVLGWDDQIGSLEAGQARRPRALAARHRRPRRHRGPGRRARARLAAPARAAARAGPPGRAARRAGRPSTRSGSRSTYAPRRETLLRAGGGVGDADELDGSTTESTHRRTDHGHRRRRRGRPRCARTAPSRSPGEFAYGSDLWMDDMLWGVTLRSPHPYARILGVDITEALKTAGRVRRAHPRRRARARSTSGSSTRTSRCSRSTWCATRASRSRWSPPTTPRPRARRPRGSSSTTRCSSRSSTPSAGACDAATARGCTRGGNLVRHVKIRTRRPAPDRRRRGVRRLRGRHAGPGVPRPGVRARRARRGRRRRPLRRDPVAARRPAADLRGARAAARTRCGSSSPGSAARSAAARTCRCTCTAACSRCTPASR